MAGGRAQVGQLTSFARAAIRARAEHLYESGQIVEHAAEEAANRVRDGFVYVITNPAFPGYVKIGCALDACSRLNEYQTYCPFRAYKLQEAVFCSDRRAAEAKVHERFAHARAGGEWFAITVDEAVTALEEVREFDPRAFGG